MDTNSIAQVAAIRRFNRFYTREIGVLQERLYRSEFSLTEVRVLYELAHKASATASELVRDLRLDPGYLSRILKRFEKRGLLQRSQAERDARQWELALTPAGHAAYLPLDTSSEAEVRALLERVAPGAQTRLVAAMRSIEEVLAGAQTSDVPYTLRTHRVGDMSWIVHRHALLYAEEYGWNEEFEALVAGIAARFIEHYDPRWERCWMAEKGGIVVGSVMVVRHSKIRAKLRLLYVEPTARNLGIGARLVGECIRFSREAGYKKLILWTNSILTAARHIYEDAGFVKIKEESHRNFGSDLVAETWELSL